MKRSCLWIVAVVFMGGQVSQDSSAQDRDREREPQVERRQERERDDAPERDQPTPQRRGDNGPRQGGAEQELMQRVRERLGQLERQLADAQLYSQELERANQRMEEELNRNREEREHLEAEAREAPREADEMRRHFEERQHEGHHGEEGERYLDVDHELERAERMRHEMMNQREEMERARYDHDERREGESREHGHEGPYEGHYEGHYEGPYEGPREGPREVGQLVEHLHHMSQELERVGDELAHREHEEPAHHVRQLRDRAMEILEAIETRRDPIDELGHAAEELTRTFHEHLPEIHEMLGHPPEGEHHFQEMHHESDENHEMDHQIAKLHQAAELLAQAGRGEMSEQLHQEAEALEREMHERHEQHHEETHHDEFPHEAMMLIEELRNEVNELREQLHGMREQFDRR